MASVFAQETFNAVDADALDAVGEIVNCINGLVSAALEETDSTLDLCPAQYSDHLEAVVCDKMLVLPLRILGKKMDFIMAIENEIQMK